MTEIALSGEEGVGNGGQLIPKKMCQKILISRQTPGYLAHWTWPKFSSKHFINLLTSQPDVLF